MPLNIYFAGAIMGDDRYVSSQERIIDFLRCETDEEVHVYSERSPDHQTLDVEERAIDIFLRDLRWLFESDAIVAEVTGESFGTGWEIAYAQKVGRIPVLCLNQQDKPLPSLVAGNTHQGLWVGQYSTQEEAEAICEAFISHVVIGDTPDETNIIDTAPIPSAEDTTPNEELWVGELEAHELQAISLLDLNDQERYLSGKECCLELSGGGMRVTGSDTKKSLFRELVENIETSKRGVFLAEGSEPSTDLGWATCFAQVNNVQPIIFHEEDIEVSWLLIGQQKYVSGDDYISENLNIPWVQSKFPHRTDGHSTSRPCAIPIAYSDFESLVEQLDSMLTRLQNEYDTKESTRGEQESLFPYANLTEPERRDVSVIVAETLLRNALWPVVTRKGFESSFLDGERPDLITLLLDHEPLSGPKEYYTRIQHRINFEEKAFAKNIRALKDAGILFKTEETALSKPPHIQKRLDEFKQFSPLSKPDDGDTSTSYQASFTTERLIFTHYGRDLAMFLQECSEDQRELSIADLERFIERHSKSVREEIDLDYLQEKIERNMGYLFDDLDGQQRENILELVNSGLWQFDGSV